MDEWISKWLNKGMSEWLNKGMSEWLNKWMSEHLQQIDNYIILTNTNKKVVRDINYTKKLKQRINLIM